MISKHWQGISLFSSGGIGDLAVKANDVAILVAAELNEQRAKLHCRNFPETTMIAGDIWETKEEIISLTKQKLAGDKLDFVFATPPCQGMSKNGQGKLLSGIRKGIKPKFDVRNQLIIPTLDIIIALQPDTVFLENVPEMENTFILNEPGEAINIIEYIKIRLGEKYQGKAEIAQFADYGIPQRRARLITVFTKQPKLIAHYQATGSFLPSPTHAKEGNGGKRQWVTLKNAIADLPKLDGKTKSSAVSPLAFHYVPVLDPKKYQWIFHTPPEKGAFDNQCVNPQCLFQENPTHGSRRDEEGVNKASNETPLHCQECGELLPRPYTQEADGSVRLMSGYTSAYKRMAWDRPAATITTNLSYPSSDHKLHPEQHRVLSLYEAFILHTLNKFAYKWETAPATPAKDTLIAEVLGESIPPYAIYLFIKHLLEAADKAEPPASLARAILRRARQLGLPY